MHWSISIPDLSQLIYHTDHFKLLCIPTMEESEIQVFWQIADELNHRHYQETLKENPKLKKAVKTSLIKWSASLSLVSLHSGLSWWYFGTTFKYVPTAFAIGGTLAWVFFIGRSMFLMRDLQWVVFLSVMREEQQEFYELQDDESVPATSDSEGSHEVLNEVEEQTDGVDEGQSETGSNSDFDELKRAFEFMTLDDEILNDNPELYDSFITDIFKLSCSFFLVTCNSIATWLCFNSRTKYLATAFVFGGTGLWLYHAIHWMQVWGDSHVSFS